MPYRIDLPNAPADAVERLIELGALDVDEAQDGVAAILPDNLTPQEIENALGLASITISHVRARDDGSIWFLRPRSIRIRRFQIVPADMELPGALRLHDSDAFGTGLHPTTSLCLEALDELLDGPLPDSVLDVGTGTGVLALAALLAGTPRAVGIDIDPQATEAAVANAHLNRLGSRFHVVCATPDSLKGLWPLVFANILAAPLMEMAPGISRRVARGGRLILSGIPESVSLEVTRAYEQVGMRQTRVMTRDGWAALVFSATW